MAKDPGDRYQSAGDMRNDIQRALSGVPIAAPTRAATYQGTRRMGPATAVAGPTGAIPAYDYGPDDQPPPGGRRRRWPWIVAALILLAVIAGLIFAFNYISGSGGNIAVPSVVGETQQQAVKAIDSAHLKPVVVLRATSSTPKGHVISTSPPNGTFVQKNSVVKLFVSTGPGKISLPDVRGDQLTQAANILQAKGLLVTEKPVTSTAPSGQVVKETPPPGTQVAPGTQVTLYYSRGGSTVPSVIGDPVATAQQILQGAGFRVVTKTVPGPAGSTPGVVFSQNPSGGTLPAGSAVTIYVAATPKPTPTPTTSSPSPSPSTSSPSPTTTPPATP